jgi:hypothetical protein
MVWPYRCHCGKTFEPENPDTFDWNSDVRCAECGCQMAKEWSFPPVPQKGCRLIRDGSTS